MNKKLKRLEIVYENCETCAIPVKNIRSLYVRDITTSLSLMGNVNIYEEKSAKSFCVIFDKAEYKTHFGDYEQSNFLDRTYAFNDITHIALVYEDDSEDYLGVEYKSRDESRENEAFYCDNIYQKLEETCDDGDFWFTLSITKDNAQ
jgi:hypothetical protein